MPVTAGVGLGFWVVPSSHMLEGEDAAAASQGQGMQNNGEVGPKEEI